MGVHQRGSHFPICVFTNNVGRRSPEKLEERKRKHMQRSWRGPQWWAQGSQEGCTARSKSRPRGDIPAVARDWTAVAVDQPRMGRQSGEWGGVGERLQDRSDRWSATWSPGYAARPDSWRESWAAPDAGRLPAAAAEPCFIVQSLPWKTRSDGQDEWTPAHALRQSLEGCLLSGPFPSLADTEELLQNLLQAP